LNRVGSPFHYFSGDRHWLHTKTVGSCKFNYHTITTTMAPESVYHNDRKAIGFDKKYISLLRTSIRDII
jgi:hypothetical protein